MLTNQSLLCELPLSFEDILALNYLFQKGLVSDTSAKNLLIHPRLGVALSIEADRIRANLQHQHHLTNGVDLHGDFVVVVLHKSRVIESKPRGGKQNQLRI